MEGPDVEADGNAGVRPAFGDDDSIGLNPEPKAAVVRDQVGLRAGDARWGRLQLCLTSEGKSRAAGRSPESRG